jgi:hypothetical protein
MHRYTSLYNFDFTTINISLKKDLELICKQYEIMVDGGDGVVDMSATE